MWFFWELVMVNGIKYPISCDPSNQKLEKPETGQTFLSDKAVITLLSPSVVVVSPSVVTHWLIFVVHRRPDAQEEARARHLRPGEFPLKVSES